MERTLGTKCGSKYSSHGGLFLPLQHLPTREELLNNIPQFSFSDSFPFIEVSYPLLERFLSSAGIHPSISYFSPEISASYTSAYCMYGRIHFLLRVSFPSVRLRYVYLYYDYCIQSETYVNILMYLESTGRSFSSSPFQSGCSFTFSLTKTFSENTHRSLTPILKLSTIIQEHTGHYPNPSRWLSLARSTITNTPMSF